jgi:S-adenosyl-L-methionine hydrolase (adenosine-forming)
MPATKARTIITLSTDFGHADPWVGVMKGVMLSINPELVIVDLTHDVAPQDIMGGALALMDSVPFFPRGSIHAAVVDPGVGSSRRAIVARTGEGYFVGPDNGLLWPAIERLGGLEKAWWAINDKFFLTPASATFHGRDIFAPVAAHLSLGLAPAKLGPEINDLSKLILPRPVLKGKTLAGEIIHVDAFGNLIINIGAVDLSCIDTNKLTIMINGSVIGGISQAYSDVPAGTALAIVGSSGRMEIACFKGNAAAVLGAGRGTPVEVKF